MKQAYEIRAELPTGDMYDFRVEAPSLTEAREFAQDVIEAQTIERPKFDWRGQVVFVDCKPAEDRVDLSRITRIPLSKLLKRESIRKELRTPITVN